MNVGKTLFAQIMEFVPWTSFARIVQRYAGNTGVRSLSCAEQFRAMAFAQLTWRESLRDVEASLSLVVVVHQIRENHLDLVRRERIRQFLHAWHVLNVRQASCKFTELISSLARALGR